MSEAPAAVPIRPAASLILWRQAGDGVQVLMGQRGSRASFMPSKFVFPGGAVDRDEIARPGHLSANCAARLGCDVAKDAPSPDRIAGAALRELTEETGLHLAPSAPLRFIFRAITPAGSQRRFDARFLLGQARDILGDPQDFSAAQDELSALQWIALDQARHFDLPFVTEIVLSEVGALLAGAHQPGVPFFDNRGVRPVFARLLG